MRFVFLDFCNTLAVERPSRTVIYAEAAEACGASLSAEQMGALMRSAHRALPAEIDGHWRYTDPWFRHFIRRIFVDELQLEPERVEHAQPALFARFRNPATFHVFPGAHELLRSLREWGLGIGVLSNWSPWLNELLDRLELSPLIDVRISSAEVRVEKPDPRIFELAAREAGVSASDCLHAGDDIANDYEGARSAGMQSVLVDHADAHSGSPHARVTSLAALGSWISAKL